MLANTLLVTYIDHLLMILS